jgi:hypothetical protein
MVQTRNKRRKCQKISQKKYRNRWSPGTVRGNGIATPLFGPLQEFIDV